MNRITGVYRNITKRRNKAIKDISTIKNLKGFDFIDLGAGDGASLVNFEKKIGGRGLGIDLDVKKVKKASELNRNVVKGNALKIDKIKGEVDFVTCDNFLEHLLSFKDAEKMIEKAVSKAKRFVYIRHPSFEDIEYLSGFGLKTYWSDWHGHTCMLKISDIVDIFMGLGITTFKIIPVARIKSSSDKRIIPLKAPVDQHFYTPEHGDKPKPTIRFKKNIYSAFDIVALTDESDKNMPELIYQDRENSDSRPRFIL